MYGLDTITRMLNYLALHLLLVSQVRYLLCGMTLCVLCVLIPHSNSGFPILGPPILYIVEVFSCIYECILYFIEYSY